MANRFVVFDIVLGAGASERTVRIATAAVWFVGVWSVGRKLVFGD